MENWYKCAEQGIQGLSIPKAYGGQTEEINLSRAMLAMEGFGYGCRDNGLALALNAQMWTVQIPIGAFGSEEQKKRFLPDILESNVWWCQGYSEPGSE